MGTKRYIGRNESLSFNLGVSPAGMRVAHSASSPSKPALSELAYQSYAGYCRRLGIVAMSFESWTKVDSGVNPNIEQGQNGFHRSSAPLGFSVGAGSRSVHFGQWDTDDIHKVIELEPHASDFRSGWER